MLEWFIRGCRGEARTREHAVTVVLDRIAAHHHQQYYSMDNFSVELDQAQGVFLPGQNVSGFVQFHLTAEESFKGISIVSPTRMIKILIK